MSRKTIFKRIAGGLVAILLTLVIGYLAIRPIHMRWGATAEDLARAMPGDLDGARWTRAITIRAAPEQVWPWLVQWGQGRGGWYSYDWLENLLGFDIHSANRILPEYQDLAIGDPICVAPETCLSQIAYLQPYQWLGWQAKDDSGIPEWSFMFGLFPAASGQTRLVIRESFRRDGAFAPFVSLIEIPDVVMEQKSLDTVKARVEGRRVSPWTTAAEIGLWLGALVLGIAAGMLVLRRSDWRGPLAVGLAAVLVLLALTFLYPPLWLRAGFDLALLASVIWAAQKPA